MNTNSNLDLIIKKFNSICYKIKKLIMRNFLKEIIRKKKRNYLI